MECKHFFIKKVKKLNHYNDCIFSLGKKQVKILSVFWVLFFQKKPENKDSIQTFYFLKAFYKNIFVYMLGLLLKLRS